MIVRFVLGMALVAALLVTQGCSEKSPADIAAGAVTNGVYYNEHFRLSVTFPPGWDVNDMAAGPPPPGPNVTNLFRVSERPRAQRSPFNPSLGCSAEDLSDWPGVMEGVEYLEHVRGVYLNSGEKVTVYPDISYTRIGGRGFDVLRADVSKDGLSGSQKIYVMVEGDYVLIFVLSFESSAQEDVLEAALRTARFD